MLGLNELDYYEVLEVPRDASLEAIDRAYQILHEAYAAESLALYSVFSEGDAELMRDRLEEAHRVLSDFELRREYDASSPKAKGGVPVEVDTRLEGNDGWADVSPLESPPTLGDQMEEPEDGNWNGDFLRRARIHAGIELEQIAEITKIGIRTLRLLEDDAYEDLPATVYVRGFVTAYVSTIGIEPTRVVASYIQRLEESRLDEGRGRFLGRR